MVPLFKARRIVLSHMRAVRVSEHGGPEVLTVEEIDRPDPDAGELLVEVAAAGLTSTHP